MRLLVDQNLAARVAAGLREAGHDAVQIRERGLATAEDDEILALAAAEHRVFVSEDTDFGALLARSGSQLPSFVLIRAAEPLTSDQRTALLVANVPGVEAELEAIVVLGRSRVRIRPLPLAPPDWCVPAAWYRLVPSGAVTARPLRSRRGHDRVTPIFDRSPGIRPQHY